MPAGLLKTLSPRFARRPDRRYTVWRAHFARRPFVRLVAHFLWRLVRGGNDAASMEFELGAGGLLGLLAAPGAFSCALLLDKYSYSTIFNYLSRRPADDIYTITYGDRYLFLSLAMAVTGIVTVLKWDRILPDSQDYLNLAPLPVPSRDILLANAAAIAIAVVVLAIDVNGVSALFFPLLITTAAQTGLAAFMQFAVVHAACVILASAFTFCAVFALLGILAAVLPRAAFQAAGSWVRGAVLVGFILLLIGGYAGPSVVVRLVGESRVQFLPSFWYLGLYQAFVHRDSGALAQAARLALPGAGAALALMVVSYSLSYRRRFAGVLEGGRRPSEHRLSGLFLRFLDLFAARARAFPRACHRFVVRALLRNEAHRLCLAVSIGLGWLLGLQENSALQAPLMAAYLLLLGLRLAFEIPAAVPANWIFRAVLDPRENESQGVARLVMLSFLVPFVFVPSAVLAWWHSGPGAAVLETACVLILSLCLMEFLLHGYRKIPLTCPVPGFRENLLLLCLVQAVGFESFTRLGAALERSILERPVLFPLLPAVMTAGWFWKRERIKEAREAGELEAGLIFENLRTPAVERLNLSE